MTERAHCVCLSGLTEAQAKLLEMAGCIGAIEWIALEASFALSGEPVAGGDPVGHRELERFRLELSRMRDFCRRLAWPGGSR